MVPLVQGKKEKGLFLHLFVLTSCQNYGINGPLVKTSKRAPEVTCGGRGLKVICTRGWGPVSPAHVLARSAIRGEPGNKAKWGWPC